MEHLPVDASANDDATAVVADTPFNHDWNRSMFREAAADIEVAMVEVALQGDPGVLRERAVLRAARGDVHEIKANFSVNGPEYHAPGYQPVLGDHQVVHVDTTNLDELDLNAVVEEVYNRLDGQIV